MIQFGTLIPVLARRGKSVMTSQQVRHAGILMKARDGTDIGQAWFPFPPGQRQFEQIRNWSGSAAIFGVAGTICMIYVIDWEKLNSKIPFYGGKFSDEAD